MRGSDYAACGINEHKKARPEGTGREMTGRVPGVTGSLPVHACVAPTRQAVVMMHVMVWASGDHGRARYAAWRPWSTARRGECSERGTFGARISRGELRSRALVNKITMHRGAPRCVIHDQVLEASRNAVLRYCAPGEHGGPWCLRR